MTNGLFKLVDDVILKKEKSFDQSTDSTEMSSDKSSDNPQIFIDQLFKKRNVFSFEEMRDEITTVILAVRMNLEDKK